MSGVSNSDQLEACKLRACKAIFKHGNSLICLQHNLLIAVILAKKLCCRLPK